MAKGLQKELAILVGCSGETVLKCLRIKRLVRLCAPEMLSDGPELSCLAWLAAACIARGLAGHPPPPQYYGLVVPTVP